MSPNMTRSDELKLRGRLADHGISVQTNYYLAGSRHPELSLKIAGSDHVIHRGPLMYRMPDDLPLDEHIRDESVLVVSRDGKIATVLAADLNSGDTVRAQLPVDATHLLFYGEAYDECAGATTTYVEMYSPIY